MMLLNIIILPVLCLTYDPCSPSCMTGFVAHLGAVVAGCLLEWLVQCDPLHGCISRESLGIIQPLPYLMVTMAGLPAPKLKLIASSAELLHLLLASKTATIESQAHEQQRCTPDIYDTAT